MPLPPINGNAMPNCRACTMIGAPSATNADRTMASALLALILVSCGLKSTSPLAKVSVVVTGIFSASQRFLEIVVAALGENIVVAVKHRDFFQAGFLRRDFQSHRQDIGFGDRIAKYIVADGGDAVGGIRRAEDDDLGALGDRIGGLRRVGQRRAEQHQHLVLKDQFLENVDRFFFLALLVFDDQLDLAGR